MLQTIEVIVEPNGVIRPLESLRVNSPTKAILTLLETLSPIIDQPERGSGAAILQFLKSHTLSQESRRSAEEIDRQIQEERNAWD